MRRINELTHEEVLKLTNEEIARYIDRECAEEGVPLLPALPSAPEKPDAKPDVNAYEITATLRFGSKEDAEKVADYIRQFQRFDTVYARGRYDYGGPEILKPVEDDSVSIATEHYWSPENFRVHSAVLDGYQTAKKEWDKQQEEYRAIASRREGCENLVNGIVQDAHDKQRLHERVRGAFNEYVRLAENDFGQALKFFVKSDRWSADTIREVLRPDHPELFPEQAMDVAEAAPEVVKP